MSAIQHCIDFTKHEGNRDGEQEAERATAELAALKAEPDKLRRNFARYLAHDYLKNPTNIADICDESLDKTGALLGYVREAARNLKDHGVEEIAE
jgi:hypothetical protein